MLSLWPAGSGRPRINYYRDHGRLQVLGTDRCVGRYLQFNNKVCVDCCFTIYDVVKGGKIYPKAHVDQNR